MKSENGSHFLWKFLTDIISEPFIGLIAKAYRFSKESLIYDFQET